MSPRRGFTLVEVMIALLIGSVVVLLAYSTLRAGLDVEARVTAARERDEAGVAFRALLADALRHATTGDGTATLGMQAQADASGRATSLRFVSRGVMPPLGGRGAWIVGLGSDSTGVVLDAVAVDARSTPLRLTARGVRSLDVRFLPLDATAWRSAWNDPTRLPAAVEIRFLDARGGDAMPALVARTTPVAGA